MAEGRAPAQRAPRARSSTLRGNGSAPPAPGKVAPPNTASDRVRGDRALRLGAIDIGSNSIRQIVADVSRGGDIRIVDEMKA
ncbi:MAG: hypothetical protein ACREOG_02870, partial [Gemmatimonadaceae bacterium]